MNMQKHGQTITSEQKANRLAREKSPYLLQHAYNPVDWYPWGEEAFEAARRQNKPVFLSIGYSTCHWCHVMAHESFENPEIGKLMNGAFISIKVDREERPDIDMLYMTVCQMMTGSGGWPLTIIMTPEKRPFFAGTYFQRETKFGRTGLQDLIPRIKEVWEKHEIEVLDSANQITEALQQTNLPQPGGDPGISELDLAYRQLYEKYDKEHGGFGLAPKFPTPHNLMFLLRYWKRTGNSEALEMVKKTLEAMRRGGIYDHLGFGFHRYSTDPVWLVPHFEKMLYDQALTAMAYIEAFQATGIAEYAQTAREIFEYVLRDMTSPEGGFYSAEDADSEGEEGKFYLWTCDEISRVLDSEEALIFNNVYHIESDDVPVPENGSDTGRHIIHLEERLKEIAYELEIPEESLREQLERIRQKLLATRDKRVRPLRDDKILTDWNGLMIAALAKGASVFNDRRYSNAAKKAADFIFKNMVAPDGHLYHRYRDGQAALSGNLDDYAFLVHGLLELYEDTFEAEYLKKALSFNNYLTEHFRDEKSGGFFFTTDHGETLLTRQKVSYDGAVPSGNSIAMSNLLRLARITGNTDLEDKAAGIGRAFYQAVKDIPANHTQLMCAVDFALGPSYEVLVTGGPQDRDTAKLLQTLKRAFIPVKVMIYVPPDDIEIKRIAPFTANYPVDKEKPKIYICINHECRLPTTDVKKALELMAPG